MGTKKFKDNYDFRDNAGSTQQKQPQYVAVCCAADGCKFSERRDVSNPTPFYCQYHQQADRRFWPNVTQNIAKYHVFYSMYVEYAINRKFKFFETTEFNMLNKWCEKKGLPELKPTSWRCFDFGMKALEYFENNVVASYMVKEPTSVKEATKKRQEDAINKTAGFLQAFDIAAKKFNRPQPKFDYDRDAVPF